ncbi:hypothetical protein [Kordia sp.]|uniref:hypothetical protein n=1 Tax=Kordia sp. TaxID=1965332 RepID=UPI003D28F333
MKKKNLNTKLHFKKKKIASLDLLYVYGGIGASDDPTTANNSLGKQSTCPIESCTCEVTETNPIKL